MPFIEPLKLEDLKEFSDMFAATEQFLGFMPNDLLTMAHFPEAAAAFMNFTLTLYQEASLPQQLLLMVGMMTSSASGCRYCTAHNAHKLSESGADPEKIANMWAYETDTQFSPAERAALDLAIAAGQSPSAVTQENYDRLRQFYTEREIIELLYVICQFGFFNRWNDSVGTVLENLPKSFSESTLPAENWSLGKHKT